MLKNVFCCVGQGSLGALILNVVPLLMTFRMLADVETDYGVVGSATLLSSCVCESKYYLHLEGFVVGTN